jgi:hypothetical protein
VTLALTRRELSLRYGSASYVRLRGLLSGWNGLLMGCGSFPAHVEPRARGSVRIAVRYGKGDEYNEHRR